MCQSLVICSTFFSILIFLAVRVQEIINDDHRESGRIPRAVDCELTDNLGTVNSIVIHYYIFSCFTHNYITHVLADLNS